MGFGGQLSDTAGEIGKVEQFRFPPTNGKWLPYGVGGSYNYDDYPLLGAKYGASAGQTFELEDLRGKALYVADAGNPAGSSAGSNTRVIDTSGLTVTVAETNASLLGVGLGPVGTGGEYGVDGEIPSIDVRPARGYLDLYIRAWP